MGPTSYHACGSIHVSIVMYLAGSNQSNTLTEQEPAPSTVKPIPTKPAHAACHVGSGGNGLQLALGEGVSILDQAAPQGEGVCRAAQCGRRFGLSLGASSGKCKPDVCGTLEDGTAGGQVCHPSPEDQADEEGGAEAVPPVDVAGLAAQCL